MFARKEKPAIAPWASMPTVALSADFVQLPTIDAAPQLPIMAVDDLPTYIDTTWSGDKFFQSFGDTWLADNLDYDTMRRRSVQMFRTNPYGRGIIRRLVTNEINSGLTLEATPDPSLLGLDEDDLADWSENIERRFTIWGENAAICDYQQLRTFGELQQLARSTALVSGDALIVLRQLNGLPTVQIIDGTSIETPFNFNSAAPREGRDIRDGVEIDAAGRHIAFWVAQEDGSHIRVPARGARSGRLQAWMIYGTDRRVGDVRGEPILGVLLSALRDLDRYRDAELRAAVINALFAMWVKKTEPGISTNPLTGAAQRRDTLRVTNADGSEKVTPMGSSVPGVVLENLPVGTELQSFDSRRPNVNFGSFEAAALAVMGWALEVPPEIISLAFQNNYSASRAAQGEFKMYLDKSRAARSNEFGKPIYIDWALSMTLNGRVVAPGLLESWRSGDWETYGAWLQSDWAGAIKPSVDRLKEVQAYKAQVDEGFITRDRASKELNGMKFSRIAKQLRKENQQFVESSQPLRDAAIIPSANTGPNSDDIADAIMERIEQHG